MISEEIAAIEQFAFAKGAEAERERIIKLLEPYAESCEHGSCDCLSASSTIALIKGETE